MSNPNKRGERIVVTIATALLSAGMLWFGEPGQALFVAVVGALYVASEVG